VIEHPDSYPADEPNRRCPDISKAELQLGFTPQVELDDGLVRFFTWAATAYARP
jgi:UDP-glucuronate decarboxylase